MNSGHPDAATFQAQLMRFRRRLTVVSFVSHLPLAAAAGIAVMGAAALTAPPLGDLRSIWFAAGVGLTLALAWIIAVARTPSLARAAAIVDRRFGLNDRTVTALEFARDSDPVSQLIVADASAYLAAHDPRELSFEFSRRLGWLSVGIVAVFAAVVAGRSPLSPDAPPSGQGGTARAAKGASGLIQSASSPAPRDAEAKTEGAAASRGLATEPAARTGQEESSPVAEARANPTLEGAAAQPKSPTGQSASGTAAAEAQRGDRANAQGSSTSLNTGGVQRSGAGVARTDRGAGAGGGPVAGLGAGTGGVNGAVRSATLPPLLPPPARPPDADSSYAGRFRRAWSHAESPLAQERIPAGLRAYVRDYFLAIRPDGQP